jgi:hypothetical protein
MGGRRGEMLVAMAHSCKNRLRSRIVSNLAETVETHTYVGLLKLRALTQKLFET